MLACVLLALLGCGERFRMIGVGRCMYNGEFLQGLSGTLSGGHEHLQCRNMCSYIGDGCAAFTWNHCKNECVLHGKPTSLSNANTSGWVSWGSADGCPINPLRPHKFLTAIGGSFPTGVVDPSQYIVAEGGKCSSVACFIHEKPCDVDKIMYSNGAYLQLKGLFAPTEVTVLKCPQGYGGTVSFQCSGVGEMIRLSGWCGLHCEEQRLNLPGLKQLKLAARRHGEIFDPGCKALIPNTHGDLVLVCEDNAYVSQGYCGKNCPAGKTEDGNFTIASSMHGIIEKRPCPDGYSGSIVVECANSVAKSVVACQRNCPSKTILVDTVGSALVEFLVLDRFHDEITVESCPAGYTGELEILCSDGVLSSEGTCGLDCSMPGKKKFGPVDASWSEYLHHNEVADLDCEEGGTMLARCYGGDIEAVNEEDGCYYRCEARTFVNNGKRTEVIPSMIHGENVTVVCPAGSSGDLLLQCRKGFFRHVGGFCGLDCEEGVMVLPSGVRVSHKQIKHDGRLNAVCESGYTGNVEVNCNNALTEAIAGNCQPDIPDCLNLVQIVYQNKAEVKAWFDDRSIQFRFDVALRIGENTSFPCPTQWGVSNVIAKCNAGPKLVLIGSCGFPCGLDRDTGAELPGSEPPRMHYEEYRVPCTNFPGLGLEAVRRCVNGNLEVTSYCGTSCNSDALDGHFEGTLKPEIATVVPHSLNITARCDAEANFSGSPVMICTNGTFGPLSGVCGLRCINETYDIDMDHLEVTELPCDVGYSGRQLRKCSNGDVEYLPPECYADCTTYGYIQGVVPPPGRRYWETPSHHGLETLACSSFLNDPAIDGTVTRSCVDGFGIISQLSCVRHCIDISLASAEYSFPIKIARLNHSLVSELPCGYPLFEELWRGLFSVTCNHGDLSVTQFGCESHCAAGLIVNNDVQVAYELIELDTTVRAPCDRFSDNELTLTCVNQLVAITDGWCFRICPAGNLDGYAYKQLLHGMVEHVDCGEGFIGVVDIECTDGVAAIKASHCTAHCAQSVVYPGGPPVSMLPVEHNAVHTVPCERGFANVRCDDGRLELVDMHAELCGYRMPLCACCPNAALIAEKEVIPSRASRHSFISVLLYCML